MSEIPQNTKPKKPKLRNVSLKKLNRRYDFMMRHDDSKKEILGFKLNLLNLVLVIIGIALFHHHRFHALARIHTGLYRHQPQPRGLSAQPPCRLT